MTMLSPEEWEAVWLTLGVAARAVGFGLPAVDKKTHIPPGFMQAAPKISAHRAGSNHQYSHNLLSLFVTGSQMK